MTETAEIAKPVGKYGLHVLITGGTLDFHTSPPYEMQQGKYDIFVPRSKSVVPPFLQKRVAMAQEEVLYDRVCLKDSRFLETEDREKLLEYISASPYESILVTHGIVKMDETVNFLSENKSKIDGKVVGVVGARMPLSEYHSDAGYCLGFAIARLQDSIPGVYSFHPDSIRSETEKDFEKLVFLITGGTIDSSFRQQSDTARPYEHTVIPEFFRDALGVIPDEPDLVYREICMKDSRELSRADQMKVVQEATNLSYKNQIVTAGTYLLPDLATRFSFLHEMGKLPKSKHVFIGAMLPDDVYLNDGWFNVGYAVGKMPSLEKGVFVAMHGWTTPPGNVLKMLQEAKFELYDPEIRL